MRLWWRWRLVGRPRDPASYARRVLVNRHRSVLRRAAVEARSLARRGPEELALPAGDEQAMALWQAVQALPVRQRVVLVLRYYEDRTEAEVAQLLGLQWARSSPVPTGPLPGYGISWGRPPWTWPVAPRRDHEPPPGPQQPLRKDPG